MENAYHQSLRLQNFTVFKDVEFVFSPRVNVFVGENGTGKTHTMKALYAAQTTGARQLRTSAEAYMGLFQGPNLEDLIRQGTPRNAPRNASMMLRGHYGDQDWLFGIMYEERFTSPLPRWSGTETLLEKAERPVFIPAIEMMGHSKGFLQAAREVVLDFDETCTDLVSLLGLERRSDNRQESVTTALGGLLGGKLEYDDLSGRFYITTQKGRIPAPLLAEGIRKIATLYRLAQNGWLAPGTTLFWDEPEVNLNPKLMDEVVGAILALARSGVQVFLATHSYVILKELDLQAKDDEVRYFAFQNGDNGVTVNATDDFALLAPNPILEQYDSLYDRELTRATGRNRNGERV